MVITSKVIILLVLMFQCRFFIVCSKTVDTSCIIVMDELDKAHKRFLYRSTSDEKMLRCTYCSEETRKSSRAFLNAVEKQCAMKNDGLLLMPHLSPNCKYMNPITCVIPNPIENGEWVCPCSGLGKVKREEVLVYTNCTQQCNPGYDLVGDSFGHCGEHWPVDKNYPTEFRYGNAKCVKRESAQQTSDILIVVAACVSVLVLSGLLILLGCYCCHCCCFKIKEKGMTSNRVELQDIKSVPGSGTSSQGTQSTATTSLMNSDHDVPRQGYREDDSPWKLRRDATGHDEPKSQSWKYLPEKKTEESRKPSSPAGTEEYDTEPFELSDGAPISGLSRQTSEHPLMAVDGSGVCCKVQLSNLSIDEQCEELKVLNKVDMSTQKLVCFNMAVDILKCVWAGYDECKRRVESNLTSLCKESDPVMKILSTFLTFYPCSIGHVADWCVRKGYKSVVQCIVSEEHGKECAYCQSLLRISKEKTYL